MKARIVLGVLLAACGGGVDTQKPLQPLPPPTLEPPAPQPTPTASAPSSASKPSVQDQQKALVATIVEALNAHDPAKFGPLYTEDATVTLAGAPAPIKGRDALVAEAKKLFEAFPNATFAVARAWGKEDVLVFEWVMNAKQSGEFMGVKPTEKPVGLTGASVMWVTADGKINEEHRYEDDAAILAQIGAAPRGLKARAVPALPASVEWHWATSSADEDKNVDAAKSSFSAFEKKDDKTFADLTAENVVWDDQLAPAPTKGKGEALKLFKAFTTAFPDVKMQTTNAWGVEDFAIVELVASGTQAGPFMGVPASKKSIALHELDVLELKDGKVEKGWSYGNGLELFSQTGSMKPRAQKPAPKADAKPAAPNAPKKPAAPKKDAKPVAAPK